LAVFKMDPRVKALKIKTGVVKRTGKEKLSYRKEAEQQKVKLEKMKAEGKDEADVKKMGEVRNLKIKKHWDQREEVNE